MSTPESKNGSNEPGLRCIVKQNLEQSGVTHLLLGFPKCGTTSLAHWLGTSPSIEVSNPKETFLLCREHRIRGAIAPEGELHRCFTESDQASFRLEASTRNVFSDILLELLSKNSRIKVILIFREPAAAVRSWHNQLVQGGEAFDESFEACWRHSIDRDSDARRAPAHSLELMRDYTQVFKFGFWIDRWIQALGHERVMTVKMSEMKSDDIDLRSRFDAFFQTELNLLDSPPVLNSYAKIRFEIGYRAFKNSKLNSGLRELERKFKVISHVRRTVKEKFFRKSIAKPHVESLVTEMAEYFTDDLELAERIHAENRSYWSSSSIGARAMKLTT